MNLLGHSLGDIYNITIWPLDTQYCAAQKSGYAEHNQKLPVFGERNLCVAKVMAGSLHCTTYVHDEFQLHSSPADGERFS